MTPAAVALALLIYALWGGNNLAIKVSVDNAVPPLAAAAIRFAQALVCFVAWAKWRRVPLRPEPAECWRLAGLSALFCCQIATLNIGQSLTTAARGTVFLASHPLFLALFASLLVPGERLRGWQTVCLLLAFGGILVTFLEGFLSPGGGLLGDAVIVISALLLGLRLTVLKLIVQDVPVVRTLFWQALLALPCFILGSLLWEAGDWGPVAGRHVAALAYQGLVIAGFGFAANAWLLERFRASEVAAYTFTTPLWGVILCGLILREPISGWVVAGVVLVAAGIALANRAAVRQG